MSLVKCPDCGHDVSEQAALCVQCGRPMAPTDESSSRSSGIWGSVTRAKTPINIFALAMMACASVLGYSATQVAGCDARIAFTYAIHAFLAVAGMFFLAILFCRKSIYHPEDLARVKPEALDGLGEDRPMIAAGLIVVMLLGYGFYQSRNTTSCDNVVSQQQETVKQASGARHSTGNGVTH